MHFAFYLSLFKITPCIAPHLLAGHFFLYAKTSAGKAQLHFLQD